LRDTSLESLRGGPDAAVMNKGRGSGEQLAEWRVPEVADIGREGGRNLLAKSGEKHGPAPQGPGRLDRISERTHGG